jgi:maltose alpha-D-glucosyltransferase/alpha-amylase
MRRRPPLPPSPTGLADEPDWYKDAVIYEVRTRSFADSNGDGLGDLGGLTERLDYLADLGITAVWLLPLCPSPGRDDGYDISDYTDIHPDVGTLDDFRRFLAEAHRRGIRVITELVLNHTSDQHPWFQRARRAAPGTVERDFYVWSDSPEKYRQARIIFKDFELSNWTWDPLAKAYFWHRFYSHQPDLNFDNPAVEAALFEVLDFWFGLGVDGLRLDAVPYLFEREGTNCENLPETHGFLRRLRAHVDARFPNRMLLAEANQWPEDAAAYYGAGDECHMNFHFPIMPRIFMAMHMEDRLPVMDILAQTPAPPAAAQWALFLRNHDELTLEMVTDEERDYMYRAYARDPSARINLGIRRRLAPLLGNNRRNIELVNGLLFSLPGTPVVYYGDEIGMGDNIYLGDRNGVRTPMQWSADRNAGFSRANPQRLILPLIVDPEYHYESLNVEAQQNNGNSLLWWTKRLVALRRRFKAFGRGTIEFLQPDNPRVLAFVRQWEDETVLVAANLSRHVQYVELDLARWRGLVPSELFGGAEFPPISDRPYLLTLGGHEFFWFSLARAPTAEAEAREAAYHPPVLRVPGPSPAPPEPAQLERVLPDFFAGRRWFGGGRQLAATRLVDGAPLGGERDLLRIALIRAEFTTGDPELYALPLAFESGERAAEVRSRSPQSVIALVRVGAEEEPSALVFDALADPARAQALLSSMRENVHRRGAEGDLVATSLAPLEGAPLEPRALRTEHRFAALAYGDAYLLRFFRRLGEGMSPELEIGRFLAARAEPPPVPRLVGALEWRPRRGEAVTLATLHDFVPGAVVGEVFAREELARFIERVLTTARDEPPPPLPVLSPVLLAGQAPPPRVLELLGPWLDTARLLGRRVAALHLALARTDDPAFVHEPYSTFDQRSVYQTNRNLAGRVLRLLRAKLAHLPPASAEAARTLLEREPAIFARFEPLRSMRFTSLRGRYHGDLRLGKVLFTGKDFVLVGFEGDTSRPLPERRRKRSPLRDVAGLLRSMQEVSGAVLFDPVLAREGDRPTLEPWLELWTAWSNAALVQGYLETAQPAPFLPRDRAELSMLVDRFVFEKALKTLGQRLESPPMQVDRVLRFLLAMLDRTTD